MQPCKLAPRETTTSTSAGGHNFVCFRDGQLRDTNAKRLQHPCHDSTHNPASLCRWSAVQGAPEVQLEACAVVQPVGRKPFLLLAESHCEYSTGTGAHIHSDQPCHFLLPALNTNDAVYCPSCTAAAPLQDPGLGWLSTVHTAKESCRQGACCSQILKSAHRTKHIVIRAVIDYIHYDYSG